MTSSASHAVLRALDRLEAEDPLGLVARGGRWWVTDAHGTAVGRLAKKFAPPSGARYMHGSAQAIKTRFREDSDEECQSQLKREVWPVVLPALVFDVPHPGR